MVLHHCRGPLEDSNKGLRGTLDLLHGEVIRLKDGGNLLDGILRNIFLVEFLHALHELAGSVQEVGSGSLEEAIGVTFNLAKSSLLWLVAHHVAGNFHSQHNCGGGLSDTSQDVEVIFLQFVENLSRLFQERGGLAELGLSFSHQSFGFSFLLGCFGLVLSHDLLFLISIGCVDSQLSHGSSDILLGYFQFGSHLIDVFLQ
mmetsp:Transcript_20687/g.31672  ORF Transcript_20687/g.31672 Transcript_20687/m.31672 type:complete len:201 (-) Transcript_20687:323-925(-)